MKQTRQAADRFLRCLADEICDLKRQCDFARESYIALAVVKSRPFDAVRSGAVSDPTGDAVLSVESLSETLSSCYAKMLAARQLFLSLLFRCSREEKDVMCDYYLKNLRVKDIIIERNLSEITVKKRLCAGRDRAYEAICRMQEEKA